MKKKRILIVDDEREFLQEMERSLTAEGYEVDTAADGEVGLAIALVKNPDVAILDIRMPGMNGLELCRRLRKSNPDTRLLFLTALQQDTDKIRGLDSGADDYMTKPFNMLELKARIKALLRRSASYGGEKVFGFGDVTVDLTRREVMRKGDSVDLTAKEFDLLACFMRHEGEVLSRETLLDKVWEDDGSRTDRTIDTHIAHLRKKLEEEPHDPRHFLTVHGVGYKFVV